MSKAKRGIKRFLYDLGLDIGIDENRIEKVVAQLKEIEEEINLDPKKEKYLYANIIKNYYGIDCKKQQTLKKISEDYCVTAHTIRNKIIYGMGILKKRVSKDNELLSSKAKTILKQKDEQIFLLERKIESLLTILNQIFEMASSVDPNYHLELIKIEDLGLSTRAFNCLERGGIKTVKDLRNKTDLDLLMLKNFGEKTLLKIKEALNKIGL